MKTLILISWLLSGFAASAELAIYNFTGTQTVVGSGLEAKVRVFGVLIVDLEDNHATRVGRFIVPAGRRFTVSDEPQFKAWRAQGPKATMVLVTSGQGETNNGAFRLEQVYYSGKESQVIIGPGTNAVRLPKSIKGSGYAVIDEGGEYASGLGIITLAHSYSPKETVGANTRGETREEAVARWRQTFINLGHVEVDDE